jgi:exodeoxyribonuclease VII small subunit
LRCDGACATVAAFSHNRRRNTLIVVKKTARKTAGKSAPADFESALSELEALVERMEAGEQPLEEALQDFERGVELFRLCQGALKDAEQKVRILLEKSGQTELADFDGDA